MSINLTCNGNLLKNGIMDITFRLSVTGRYETCDYIKKNDYRAGKIIYGVNKNIILKHSS